MSDLMKSILLIAAVSAATVVAINFGSNKNATVRKLTNPGA